MVMRRYRVEATVSDVAKDSVSGGLQGRTLRGLAGIRTFFRTNTRPIFFVGPTAFNQRGVDP